MRLPRVSLSLSAWLTLASVIVVLTSIGLVGGSGYLAARNTAEALWSELGHNVVDRTRQHTLRFLEGAQPFTRASIARVKDGTLDPEDQEAILRWLENALDANPSFTWAGYGDRHGTYLAAYRWPGESQPRRTWRDTKTNRVWTRSEDGSWSELPTEPTSYDPRVRPWYQGAIADPEGHWTEAYAMASRQQAGVSFSQPLYVDGELIGVFGVDYEAAPLSAFAAEVRPGAGGRVYLVDHHGNVIGHPDNQVFAEGKVLAAAEHPDPILSAAWASHQALPEHARNEPYTSGEHLVLSATLDSEGLPWEVLVTLPASHIFGPALAQARRAALLSVTMVSLLILGGMALSRVLGGALDQLRQEMYRLSRLELEQAALTDSSWLSEVNQMAEAATVMREGLDSFGRYVPRRLVTRLLAQGQQAQLGVDRDELTVLFSDIAGFTTFTEGSTPEAVLERLGIYLDRMNKAIAGNDGTVAQYLGDGILVFWGAPVRQRDHALRACRGALAMQAAVDELVADALAKGEFPLHTRIGVNSGDLLVGNIGAPDRFSYTVIGDPVNAASRIEGLNRIYGTRILLGERTVALLDDALATRPIDWVRVKGKQQPLLVHELVGEQVSAAVASAHGRYAEALEAYRAKRFADALAGFEQVDAELGGDQPSSVLAERCRQLLARPPGEAWDGVFVMTEK